MKASNTYGDSEKDFTLSVYTPVEIATASFKDGITGKNYSATLKLKNADKTVKWSAEGLPNGLSITEKGKISGKPTVYGTFSVRITASNGAESVSKTIKLTINAIAPKLSGSLAKANLGKSYSSKLKLTKGTEPVTWDLEGSLPDGLTFDDETGTLSGTPLEIWNDTVIITAENDGGRASKTLKLTVKGTKPSSIKPGKLPDGKIGVRYPDTELSAKGSPTITWSVSGLPAGLKLEGNKITGTPTESGKKISFTVTASNPAGEKSKTYKINIDPADASSEEDTRLPVFGKTPSASYGLPAMNGGLESDGADVYDGYVIAADMGTVSADEAGMHEFGVVLNDDAPVGWKLVYMAGSDDPSDDDEIAEFYDETGEEITAVPENRLITISIWLNPGTVYKPQILAVSE